MITCLMLDYSALCQLYELFLPKKDYLHQLLLTWEMAGAISNYFLKTAFDNGLEWVSLKEIFIFHKSLKQIIKRF